MSLNSCPEKSLTLYDEIENLLARRIESRSILGVNPDQFVVVMRKDATDEIRVVLREIVRDDELDLMGVLDLQRRVGCLG